MFRNSKYFGVQIIENYRYIRLLLRLGMNYFRAKTELIKIVQKIFF
jgi:hypothetical protein